MLFVQHGPATPRSGSSPFVHSTTTLMRLRHSSSSRAGWGAAAAVAVLVIASVVAIVQLPALSGGRTSSQRSSNPQLSGSDDESLWSSKRSEPCYYFSLDTEGHICGKHAVTNEENQLKGLRDIGVKALATNNTYRTAITEGVKSHSTPTEGTPKPWRDAFTSMCDFLEAETPKDRTPCFVGWNIRGADVAKIVHMNRLLFGEGPRPACAAAFVSDSPTIFDARNIMKNQCGLERYMTEALTSSGMPVLVHETPSLALVRLTHSNDRPPMMRAPQREG